MKRSFNQIALIAVFLLTLGVTTSFAAGGTDNGGVTTSFRNDFKQAEILSSEFSKDHAKITFKMNGMILFAFYNSNGELLALSHNIKPSQLPISLLMPIKQKYANCWVTDCFEFDANGSASYYIVLENADTKLTLHSVGNDWEVQSKSNKN
jgi:hypothetical protein